MSTWNSTLSSLPNSHFLQTFEWGQVKAKYGWKPLYAVWTSDGKSSVLDKTEQSPLNFDDCIAAARILKRQILNKGFAKRLSIPYSPKGPLLDWSDESLRNRVMNDLQSFTKRQGAIFPKLDPDVVLGTGIPGREGEIENKTGQALISELERHGWRYSSDQIQFRTHGPDRSHAC